MTLASIIVPCYNAERYVGEAVESALGQTYPNVEVVVVDDGSTDGSVDVLRSFGDRIRWETGENRGACAARNRGLAMAEGELIQFLDADDLLHAEKLERQAAELERSGADMVCCFGQCEAGGDQPDQVYQRPYDGGDPVVFVLGGVLQTSAPLHRRENLEAVGGFREDLPCAQEKDLHLRLAIMGLRFHQWREVLYTVRRVEGSVSSNWGRVLDTRLGILMEKFEELARAGNLTEGRRRAFSEVMARDGRANLTLGRWSEARRCFRIAARWHRSRGLKGLYGTRRALFAHKVIGPVMTARLSRFRRRLGTT